MLFVVLCPGTPEGSTGRRSGFKASQKTGQRLKVSSDRLDLYMVYTHYHNSNLIWRTLSRRVDEVIPSDHPRRVASSVIQWHELMHET